MSLTRDQVAARVAAAIAYGAYVNLGIGAPTLVADHLRPVQDVVLHTENGMLGMGSEATGGDVDGDLINAGKVPVTETTGCSYFHHADSFATIRGQQDLHGHRGRRDDPLYRARRTRHTDHDLLTDRASGSG